MSESKKRPISNDDNEQSSDDNSGSDVGNAPDCGNSSESCSDSESEFDENEVCKLRRSCVRKMLELERQFNATKESLYAERILNVEHELRVVKDETSAEYRKRLSALQENLRSNDETADVLRDFQLNELKNRHESERLAALQDFENKKHVLFDRLKEDAEAKMAKLKADKMNADVNFEFWQRETRKPTKPLSANTVISNKRSGSPIVGSSSTVEKRRKPVTVSGPHIVYMLRQKDILEDWNLIQRAIMQVDIGEENI